MHERRPQQGRKQTLPRPDLRQLRLVEPVTTVPPDRLLPCEEPVQGESDEPVMRAFTRHTRFFGDRVPDRNGHANAPLRACIFHWRSRPDPARGRVERCKEDPQTALPEAIRIHVELAGMRLAVLRAARDIVRLPRAASNSQAVKPTLRPRTFASSNDTLKRISSCIRCFPGTMASGSACPRRRAWSTRGPRKQRREHAPPRRSHRCARILARGSRPSDASRSSRRSAVRSGRGRP